MEQLRQTIDTFWTSPSRVFCLTGSTGSGKTTGVIRYFGSRRDVHSLVLLPKRVEILGDRLPSSTSTCKVMSISSFVQSHLLPSKGKRDYWSRYYDVVVVDEFHQESTEQVVLMAFLRTFLQRGQKKKAIFATATLCEQHKDTIAEFLLIAPHRWTCFELASTAHPYTYEIHYLSEIPSQNPSNAPNNHGAIQTAWSTPRYATQFVGLSAQQLSVAVRHILRLEQGRPGFQGRLRVLVFLFSADSCDQTCDYMRNELSDAWEVLSCHGQVEKSDLDYLFSNKSTSQLQLILSTNLTESSITLKDVNVVIDFGVAYIPTAWSHGQVTLQWCSQAEMIQRAGRTGRTCNGRVYRMMTEDTFQRLPYVHPQSHDWMRLILQQMTVNYSDDKEHSDKDSGGARRQTVRLQNIFHEALGATTSAPTGGMVGEVIQNHLLDLEADMEKLSSWRLDDTSRWPSKEWMQALLRSPLQPSNFSLVLTAMRWSKTKAKWYFVTMVIALIDTISRFGASSLHYFLRKTNSVSVNTVMTMFKKIVCPLFPVWRVATASQMWETIWLYANMVSQVYTMKAEGHKHDPRYQFFFWNGRVHRQFLTRWRALVVLDGQTSRDDIPLQAITCMRESGWVMRVPVPNQEQYELLAPRLSRFAKVCLRDQPPPRRPVMGHQAAHQAAHQAMPAPEMDVEKISAMMQRYSFQFSHDAWEEMLNLFWLHHPVSTEEGNHFIFVQQILDLPCTLPSSHLIYTLTDRPNLPLPPPRPIRLHVQHCRKHLSEAVQERERQREETRQWREQYDACVFEIANEVAFRPGMAGFLEGQEDFYSHCSHLRS